MNRSLGSAVLLSLAVFAAGCGSVAIEGAGYEFPRPLVPVLPLHMGIYYQDELTSFVHEEEIEESGDYRIAIGAAQQPMFEQLLAGMFRRHSTVKRLDRPGIAVDAILAPRIEEFQFTVPAQTRSEYFEVWIKYQIALYSPTGTIIAEWPLMAYGKSNKGDYGIFEGTRTPALEQATARAMRDAAAFFSLRFTTVPAVKAWLEQRRKARQEVERDDSLG